MIYIVANILLGIHIFHGAWSMFQSLGWNNPRFNVWRRYFAIGFAAVIVMGNVSIPIAVLTGAVSLRRSAMTLDSKIPAGPARREVGRTTASR